VWGKWGRAVDHRVKSMWQKIAKPLLYRSKRTI
jgi:hypothetical protein